MPRYYFHLHEYEAVLDGEGVEFPNEEAAREYALDSARDVACGLVRQGHINLDHYVEVTDETGRPVYRVTFRDAFTVEG